MFYTVDERWDGKWCMVFTDAVPPAHYDWLGRVREVEAVYWKAIELTIERFRIDPGLSGRVQAGQQYCDLGRIPGSVTIVHVPTGKIMQGPPL